ncbi:hypothetical protein CR513_62284, partial [Mucuna pruriens]
MATSTQISFIITLSSLCIFGFISGSYSAKFTFTNKCSHTVWPAILSGAGTSPLSTTVDVPPTWSGRLWGRTLCSLDNTGKFSCATGDCGSSTIECTGGKAVPPVTLVELTLKGTGGVDFYDMSLVDSFNLPVRVDPGSRNCMGTGCTLDLNVVCPTELKVIRDGEIVACKTACGAEPCLSSQFFKAACPRAHVYTYDHAFFTCVSPHYIITFCPASSINTSWMKPAVENSRVHEDASAMKVVTIVIALLSICALFIVCHITIRLSNGDRVFHIGAGARAGTIVPNPPVPHIIV